jgi:uncharacterized protein (TIGR03435 family)
MKRTITALGVVVLSSWLLAQEFDAVSVKPSDPHDFRVMMRDMPGQANYTGITVKMLILQAYQVRDFQVVGGPKWIESNRYDIVARPPAGGPALPSDPTTFTDQQRETFRHVRQAMVRGMLADRFRLKTHKETRDLPLYVLTVAKGGPKLKESNGINASDPELKPGVMRFNLGSLAGTQLPIGDLVDLLSRVTNRIILNKTGLDGKYDFALKWTPDSGSASSGDVPLPSPASADPPGIFTALQEQLGLKLDSSKGPVEVVVIDNVETPGEN